MSIDTAQRATLIANVGLGIGALTLAAPRGFCRSDPLRAAPTTRALAFREAADDARFPRVSAGNEANEHRHGVRESLGEGERQQTLR
jgi:hypothetical protein